VRYLGVYFFSNSGFSDISDACRKFYGQFNNIMSVLGKCSRDMSAIRLIKTYCLPTMLYGCEVWTSSNRSSHRISVAWNNCFRRDLGCCRRESIRPLQHFCNALPALCIIDLRKLILRPSLRRSENHVLRTLAYLNHTNFVATASKYGFDNYMVNVKYAVWRNFGKSLL